MSSPTPSESSQPGSSQREQIAFRFCRDCSNMLYPKEDKLSSTLLFACRTCTFAEPAASLCVYRNNLYNTVGETAGVTQDVGADPTVSREASTGCCGHVQGSYIVNGANCEEDVAEIEFCLLCGEEIVCSICGEESAQVMGFLEKRDGGGKGGEDVGVETMGEEEDFCMCDGGEELKDKEDNYREESGGLRALTPSALTC